MTMFGYEFYALPNEEKVKIIFWFVVVVAIIFAVYGILYFIKNKYRDKIKNSKSKIIKKIFEEI